LLRNAPNQNKKNRAKQSREGGGGKEGKNPQIIFVMSPDGIFEEKKSELF
jgi:hypothetical protein